MWDGVREWRAKMGWFGLVRAKGSVDEWEGRREKERVRRKERRETRKEKGKREKEGEERRKGSKE